jgi:hypothetical protein
MVPVEETTPSLLVPSSGDFQIAATFNANVTAAQRAVIQQALNEWDAIIQSRGFTPGSYPISFTNGPLAARALGLCDTKFSRSSGNLISAAITISDTETFYVDPTPADDVEFAADPPPAGFDLLSVMRHEIGHAIGWTATNRTNGLIAGNVFDAPRMNIGITAGGFHCDPALHPDELMQPGLPESTRRPIRLYPTAALVGRAFQYQIPMQFVDPAAVGTQTGTAWEPWQSFGAAINLAPLDVPLLLAPQFFNVLANQTFSARHSIFSARGEATIRVP